MSLCNEKKKSHKYEIDHDKKKIIKDKIEKIHRKRHLIEMFKIINNDNDIDKTENSNGIFLHFNNLKDETYLKLENYINQIENESKMTDTEFSTTFSETNISNIIEEDYGSKLKFSNKEKNIIKRKEYDKLLSENKDIIYKTFAEAESSDQSESIKKKNKKIKKNKDK